jgi:hypothetical protein
MGGRTITAQRISNCGDSLISPKAFAQTTITALDVSVVRAIGLLLGVVVMARHGLPRRDRDVHPLTEVLGDRSIISARFSRAKC